MSAKEQAELKAVIDPQLLSEMVNELLQTPQVQRYLKLMQVVDEFNAKLKAEAAESPKED